MMWRANFRSLRWPIHTVSTVCLIALWGCTTATKVLSPGLVLPEGDAEAGRAAFIHYQCTACHRVRGDESLPATTAEPVPFRLGEGVSSRPTDERLVTHIINPNHVVRTPQRPEVAGPSGRSRMTDYTEVMRVRDLVDLVAYLRTVYDGETR